MYVCMGFISFCMHLSVFGSMCVAECTYVCIIMCIYMLTCICLQIMTFLLLFFEAIYMFIPSFWITFVIILWEGLLGGGIYVNAFYQLSLSVS